MSRGGCDAAAAARAEGRLAGVVGAAGFCPPPEGRLRRVRPLRPRPAQIRPGSQVEPRGPIGDGRPPPRPPAKRHRRLDPCRPRRRRRCHRAGRARGLDERHHGPGLAGPRQHPRSEFCVRLRRLRHRACVAALSQHHPPPSSANRLSAPCQARTAASSSGAGWITIWSASSSRQKRCTSPRPSRRTSGPRSWRRPSRPTATF